MFSRSSAGALIGNTKVNNERKSNQMLVFEERGNRSTLRKPLDAEYRTNKLKPHIKPSLGIEPGAHLWETSAAHYECVVRFLGGSVAQWLGRLP